MKFTVKGQRIGEGNTEEVEVSTDYSHWEGPKDLICLSVKGNKHRVRYFFSQKDESQVLLTPGNARKLALQLLEVAEEIEG